MKGVKVMEAVQLNSVEGVMRWTSGKKAEVVMDILKGAREIHEICREHDLKQSVVERWVSDFIETGTKGLKLRGPKEKALREAEIKELRAKIGELVLENTVLKKSQEMFGEEDEG
jgi:transposase-like protein